MQGPVLEPFSYDEAHPYASGQHRGIDIGAAAAGDTVVAPAAGTVSFAGTVPTSGKSVTIETTDGYSVTLTHLGSIAVVKGATLAELDAVGAVGPSGVPEVDGPYVHLGVRVAPDPNGYVDPLGLLPPAPDGGAAAASAPPASQGSGASSGASGSGPSASAPPSPVPASTPAVTTRASGGAHVSSRGPGREQERADERSSERRPTRSPRRPVTRAGGVVEPSTHRAVPVSRPHAGELTRGSRRPVVETAASSPAEPAGLGAGHEPRPSASSSSPRPTPTVVLPLILDGAAALVALAAALAAARGSRRRRPQTSPIAVAQVVHLPRHATERRPVSRAA